MNMNINTTEMANAMSETFRGRADRLAVSTDVGFRPRECDEIGFLAALESHLNGVQAFGFYLMDSESKIVCACADFDNKPDAPRPGWRQDVESLTDGLLSMGLEPLVEVSQSGEGAHVWLFTDGPTEAWIPRRFLKLVSESRGIAPHEIYPRQDRLAEGGIGSLVRYPLWNQSRFVDPMADWTPIEPLQAMATVHRVSGADLRLIAWQASLGAMEEPSAAQRGKVVDGLPARVKKLTDRPWSLLGRRWIGDARGMADTSPSAIAMSIACELVRAYVPTPEIEAAIHQWCRGHTCASYDRRSPSEQERWVEETVRKAYDFTVSKTDTASVSTATFRDCVHRYVDTLKDGGIRYVSTGIPALDASIEGFGPGELVVIAARPGQGKSAVAFQVLDSAARNGVPGLVISNEMGGISIGKRRLLSITGLDQQYWNAAAVDLLHDETDSYYEDRAPVYVVEDCFVVQRAAEVIEQFVSLHGVGLVVVDYLQLLRTEQGSDRYQTVTEASRLLKETAKRLDVPLVALSQLNREVEKRGDFEPKMSDLRESGQIEQDADMVVFLQWPWKHDNKMPRNEYRIQVAKRRNGRIRSPKITTTFDDERQIVGGTNDEGEN